MFLLRCVFWLSVVYGAMFFGAPGNAALRLSGAAGIRPGMPAAAAAAGPLVSGIATLCRDHATDCIRDAAGLTALVERTAIGTPDYATAVTPADAFSASEPADAIPVPVPDPRRRSRLTR